jgi:beta-glucosidase
VLPSVKHFVGDGGTGWGTTVRRTWATSENWQASTDAYKIDQGDTQIDEATLREIHLAPYQAAINAGVLNIMVSFSSWNGQKMHTHRYLLTEVLKGEMGFEGFLITDWMAIDHISPDYYVCVVEAINAGIDMVMVPFDFKAFVDTLTQAVQKGDVSEARIDDAVRRILYAKFKLGLFERPFTDEALLYDLGSEPHREVAREAVRKSLVLLKNDEVLPFSKAVATVNVAGQAADDIGLACGGWTISWQGTHGTVTDGATVLQGLRHQVTNKVVYQKDGDFKDKAEIGIVVVAEIPYAEGVGDLEDLSLPNADKQLIRRVRQYCEKLILVIHSRYAQSVEK